MVQHRVQQIEYSVSQSQISTQGDHTVKVMLAAIMRYKSRRMCKCFWLWWAHCGAKDKPRRSGVTRNTDDVQDLMQRYKFLDRADFGTTGVNEVRPSTLENVEGENVSCSSADEARLTKTTKQTVQKPTLTGGTQQEEEQPAAFPNKEDKKHPDAYYNILESKNKNFGQILQTSESQSEIGIPSVNVHQIQQRIKLSHFIMSCLRKPLRSALRKWRRETDAYLMDYASRLRQKHLQFQRQKVLGLIAVRLNFERSTLRVQYAAFSRWKIEALVEQRTMDIRQSQFLISNARLEVQRSK